MYDERVGVAPPADIVCMSMTSGNTSAIPASASRPSQPTYTASRTLMAAWTVMTTTFGAARRSRVVRIGASSRARVRGASAPAATGGATGSVSAEAAMTS